MRKSKTKETARSRRNRKGIELTLDPTYRRWLDEEAASRGISRSGLVEYLIGRLATTRFETKEIWVKEETT